MKVIKRDGSVVEYDRSKIVTAIQKANAEVAEEERLSLDRIEAIVRRIEDMGQDKLPVEDIQDLVEQGLVNENKFYLAKKYIIYRYTRALVRKANTTDESILSLIRNSNKDVMEENSKQKRRYGFHPARFDCRRGFQRLNPPHYPAGRNFQSA